MLFDKNNELSEVLKISFDAFNQAAKDPGHPFRFMSLATTHQQVPHIRYVVLRAMDGAGNLYFFTDYWTKKVEHIQANPEIALLFYDPKERSQIRMKGKALINRNNATSEKYWEMVEGEARKAYNPRVRSGTPILNPEEAHEWPAELVRTNFAVIQVTPSELDVLQLDGLSHIRAKFLRMGDSWKMDWVAP